MVCLSNTRNGAARLLVACGSLLFIFLICFSSEKKEETMTHQSVSSTDKKDGWSVGRILKSGDKSAVASLQADFNQRPGIYTAQFSITPIDPFIPPPPIVGYYAPIQAEAEIDWAVEGNTIVRKVSVANGMSISGPGQAVRIVIKDVTVGGGASLTLGQRYFTSVNVTPGLRAADSIPPIYVPEVNVSIVAPGTTLVVPVPQNIGVKSLMVTVASLTGVPLPEQTVQVYQLGPSPTIQPLAVYDPRAYQFAPVIPGCNNIMLQTALIAPDSAYFGLVWGIDG